MFGVKDLYRLPTAKQGTAIHRLYKRKGFFIHHLYQFLPSSGGQRQVGFSNVANHTGSTFSAVADEMDFIGFHGEYPLYK
jgi:hypothetical protein